MTDLRITAYARWHTASVQALTDRALTWLRTFTVLDVPDDRPVVVIDGDAVVEYVNAALLEGLEVEGP